MTRSAVERWRKRAVRQSQDAPPAYQSFFDEEPAQQNPKAQLPPQPPRYKTDEVPGQWPYMTPWEDRVVALVVSGLGVAIALTVLIARAVRSPPLQNLEHQTVYYTYASWLFTLVGYVFVFLSALAPRIGNPPMIWYRKNKMLVFGVVGFLLPAWWWASGVSLVGAGLATYAAYDIVRTHQDLPASFWSTFLNERVVHVLNWGWTALVIWSISPAIRYVLWQEWHWIQRTLGLKKSLNWVVFLNLHLFFIPQLLPMIYLIFFDVEKVYEIDSGIDPRALRGFLVYLGLVAIGMISTLPLLFYLTHSPTSDDPVVQHERMHPTHEDPFLVESARMAQDRLATHRAPVASRADPRFD